MSHGAAYVRARPSNHARAAELIALETRARAAEQGMWAQRAYRPATARAAAAVATEANANCMRGDAPFRIVEGRVADARAF